MGQLVKCSLYSKYETLSSAPRIHREEPGVTACTPPRVEVETDISLGLTGQAAQPTQGAQGQ